jgi:hypothetical protein
LNDTQFPAVRKEAVMTAYGPQPRWRSPELAAGCWGSSAAAVAPGSQGAAYARISAPQAITPGPRKRAPGSSGRPSPVARAGVVGASEIATGVVVESVVILAPGRRRRSAPRRSRRSASRSRTQTRQPSPRTQIRRRGLRRRRERVQTEDSRHRRRLWTPRAPQPEHECGDRGEGMAVNLS